MAVAWMSSSNLGHMSQIHGIQNLTSSTLNDWIAISLLQYQITPHGLTSGHAAMMGRRLHSRLELHTQNKCGSESTRKATITTGRSCSFSEGEKLNLSEDYEDSLRHMWTLKFKIELVEYSNRIYLCNYCYCARYLGI